MVNSPSADPVSADIASAIRSHCERRAPHGSICPSEVARAIWPSDWRDHMDEVRNVGIALAHAGEIEITQRGEALDPSAPLRGAIRYRIKAARERS